MKINLIKSIAAIAVLTIANANLAFADITDLYPTVTPEGKNPSKVTLVNQLPQVRWETAIASSIKLLLSIAGPLAFLSCVVGGVMMIAAQGDEEKIRKGKHVLLWSVLALIIIAASYAVVTGITQLQFIQPK